MAPSRQLAERRLTYMVPASVFLPRPLRAQADWRAEQRELCIGIAAAERGRDAIARRQPFIAYMERKLRVKPLVSRAAADAGVVEALRGGDIDFARIGPGGYALARRVMGGRIAPFAREIGEAGKAGYHSVVFVRADAPFGSLDDLRGRSFAFVARGSASGFAVPDALLRRAGLPPERYFARTGFTGSHARSVMAVLNGAYDAGATCWTSESRGSIQRLVAQQMIPAGSLRIIWTSPEIPGRAWVLRTTLPEGLRRDWVAAVTAMPEEDPTACRAVPRCAGGVVPARHEDYLELIAAFEEGEARRRRRGA